MNNETARSPVDKSWADIMRPGTAVDFELIRRDQARPGDVLWSSHYGEAKVVTADQYGNHGQTTEIVFEEVNPKYVRNERYDSSALIPRRFRPTVNPGRWTSGGVNLPPPTGEIFVDELDAHIAESMNAPGYRAAVEGHAQLVEMISKVNTGATVDDVAWEIYSWHVAQPVVDEYPRG